jgi:hypothetical protein
MRKLYPHCQENLSKIEVSLSLGLLTECLGGYLTLVCLLRTNSASKNLRVLTIESKFFQIYTKIFKIYGKKIKILGNFSIFFNFFKIPKVNLTHCNITTYQNNLRASDELFLSPNYVNFIHNSLFFVANFLNSSALGDSTNLLFNLQS